MMNERIGIPRHRIPKLHALCPRCLKGARVTMSQAYAEGYHRRHVCRSCSHAFYTITPYNGGEARMSPVPFTDRPLTEIEHDQRLAWWLETEDTPVGNLGIERAAVPFLNRVVEAITKKEGDRTPTETYIVKVYDALTKRVAAMDAQPQQEVEE